MQDIDRAAAQIQTNKQTSKTLCLTVGTVLNLKAYILIPCKFITCLIN